MDAGAVWSVHSFCCLFALACASCSAAARAAARLASMREARLLPPLVTFTVAVAGLDSGTDGADAPGGTLWLDAAAAVEEVDWVGVGVGIGVGVFGVCVLYMCCWCGVALLSGAVWIVVSPAAVGMIGVECACTGRPFLDSN